METIKKVISMVLVMMVILVLMGSFVRCKSMLNNGYHAGTDHHFAHHQYPHDDSNLKMEGGKLLPKDKYCPGEICEPFAQNCYSGCVCAPYGVFIGTCLGYCC